MALIGFSITVTGIFYNSARQAEGQILIGRAIKKTAYDWSAQPATCRVSWAILKGHQKSLHI